MTSEKSFGFSIHPHTREFELVNKALMFVFSREQ